MRRAAFFPPGLDPVLDGGPGHEDTVIAPEVPTRRPVRQAVLGNQADGRLLHAVGVMAFRQGQVGHVGVEAPAAVGAAMLGVGDHDVDRPAGAGIAQVMEGPPTLVTARGRAAATRALAAAKVATPVLDMRGR